MTEEQVSVVQEVCKKVSRYMQRAHKLHDHEDVCQDLFTEVIERDLVGKHDPAKAKLETFLIMALRQAFIRKYLKKKQTRFEGRLHSRSFSHMSDDQFTGGGDETVSQGVLYTKCCWQPGDFVEQLEDNEHYTIDYFIQRNALPYSSAKWSKPRMTARA